MFSLTDTAAPHIKLFLCWCSLSTDFYFIVIKALFFVPLVLPLQVLLDPRISQQNLDKSYRLDKLYTNYMYSTAML